MEQLASLRILIVEDEILVGMMLEETLEDAGAGRVSVAHTLERARVSVQEEEFDGVLLDINLHGETSVGIAEDLAIREIPFIVVSGYGRKESDPSVIKNAPRLRKPFTRAELLHSLAEVFGRIHARH
jgi:DNA-binding response OmpR family regulator